MRRMTELIFTIGFTMIAVVLLCACSDKLDIQQAYDFDLATLPVQTEIAQGEEAEIRCQLVRDGRYEDTEYFIRWFQPSGMGELRMEDGTVLSPNDLYPLPEETFRLYYRSLCTDQQTVDIYIVDSFNRTVKKSFSFNDKTGEEQSNGIE